MIHLLTPGRNRVRLMIYPGHSAGRPAWSVLFLCVLSISCFGPASRARSAEKVQDTGAKNATKVKYQRLKIFKPYHCLRKQHVVDDENALRALVADCKDSDIKLPKIDFSKHTMIVMSAETDWCQRLELKIIRDD